MDLEKNQTLCGLMIKSVCFCARSETLLCRALVVHAPVGTRSVYSTVNIKVNNLRPIVGFDLELSSEDNCDEWTSVCKRWSADFVADPVTVTLAHQDLKRAVKAVLVPLRTIQLASTYMKRVKGALTFGDFCPDRGYYVSRDGNTPALCSDVMFGRTYFVHLDKVDRSDTLSPADLIYDREISERNAQAFDAEHAPYFYKAACLDIETVYDDAYRTPTLACESFGHALPYCTEKTISELSAYRAKQMAKLGEYKKTIPKGAPSVTIPTLIPDMPGKQHEITCVSIVIMNTHVAKANKDSHRKELIVLYNKAKVDGEHLTCDRKLARDVGIDDVTRVQIYDCPSEFELLERTIGLLHKHAVELLYVYNADFDLRVLNQRVHFYSETPYGRRHPTAPSDVKRCDGLLRSWHGLFVARALSVDVAPLFQFENVRYIELYKDMIRDVGAVLQRDRFTVASMWEISQRVGMFNKTKAKLGHFKMNACGMNVIDLYRVAGTREIKYACTSMKLNDVAPFVITRHRKLHGRPAKQTRKLYKVADVSYDKMDAMIKSGGKSLFAVLVYNLVDSQLCVRIAKALNPVSALFHRCRTTLNIDVVVHGRGDMFGGFVQSIHSVQMPQLKFALDTLRVWAGPVGATCEDRKRCNLSSTTGCDGESWKGGAVCEPLTGLHYSGPGMGLELSFDFASMYPSIMCALNISPETTIPWPPANFPHDIQGWVCYRWDVEGFPCASLILKYDDDTRSFRRASGVFASSVEYYLNQRAEFKRKLKSPTISESERVYYKLQEGECKVLANSFYGTAPHPCGPLISGHGRRQIAVVNGCVSSFYRHKCPVIYGDTDSVMVAVGYGPDDRVESDLSSEHRGELSSAAEKERLSAFANRAREAIRSKFKSAGDEVPAFLRHVHRELVEDALKRMYVIKPHNRHEALIKDPQGRLTSLGYPIYLAMSPRGDMLNVTDAFTKDRRVKLEYENSCSVYCHVAKKTYLALTHTVAADDEINAVSVKVRGLAAFKSMRSPCDLAVTQTFIACVMQGDCVRLKPGDASCFDTTPWHALAKDDLVLYFSGRPSFDASGAWLADDVSVHRVLNVTRTELDAGYCAVSTKLVACCDAGGEPVFAWMLYKDDKYCMNHIACCDAGVLRDVLVAKVAELIASKMGTGFFPWDTLIKSAKNKHFAKQTLERLKVGSSSVKTTFVEIEKTWLQRITGLSAKPVECYEFHKCNPCQATVHRYPLALHATAGCITAMFGGPMLCEKSPREPPPSPRETNDDFESHAGMWSGVVAHPYQPENKCCSNSRVLVAHRADRTLVNKAGKLVAHCLIDMSLPRQMYGVTAKPAVVACKQNLLAAVESIRGRLKLANAAFNSLMNTCPEHMVPTCGPDEIRSIEYNKEHITRLPGEKLAVCRLAVIRDMQLDPDVVYANTTKELGAELEKLIVTGAVTMYVADRRDNHVTLYVPRKIIRDAGFQDASGDVPLLMSTSALHEKVVVNLASLLYRASLMLQLIDPTSFPSVPSLTPRTVLRIMPYSCEDDDLVQRWLDDTKQKEWLRPPRETALGKRKREIAYHCVGCREFYRDLCVNDVRGREVFVTMYDDNKRRRFGRCVGESACLS